MLKIRPSKEFVAGALVVVAVAGLYWGISFLKGNDVFKSERVFYAVYNNAQGLMKANPVTINGFQVGQVGDLYFHPDLSGRLIAKIVISNDYPVPANTVARISSDGLLGEKMVVLLLGDASKSAASGDTLQGDFEVSITETINAEVAPIKLKAEKLMGSLDTAIQVLTGFLDPKTERAFRTSVLSLENSLDHLEGITKNTDGLLADNRAKLDRLFTNLDKLGQTLAANSGELERVMNNAAAITDTLAAANLKQTLGQLEQTSTQLAAITGQIAAGKGTLGLLVHDEKLYRNVDEAVVSLEKLLTDFRAHPRRYLAPFGKRNNDEKSEE
jgi:phospholipid/cholesterol/gamma-HCH transport system substrate-binding protein